MDTAWIQVFVMTVSECVAPAGKTVCQEQQLQMQFVDQAECELALEQILSLKERADNVIVYKDKSGCAATARQLPIFASMNDVKHNLAPDENWQEPAVADTPDDFIKTAHKERLAQLSECDAVGGVAPCKIGDIIIEGAAPQTVEVWRRDK